MPNSSVRNESSKATGPPGDAPDMPRVAILTGGGDRPYALGLAFGLAKEGVPLDFVGSDFLESEELRLINGVRFLNLRGNMDPLVSRWSKIWRVCRYYARLAVFVAQTDARVLHILWNNRFELFDRTLLLLYYRILHKKLVLTVHNVNAGKRDGTDSWWNRKSLRWQYHLVDHLFVHTRLMKDELVREYCVSRDRVTVIPFGINDTVPRSELTTREARRMLDIPDTAPAILFFGNIAPYKGLEILIEALPDVLLAYPHARLIVAGRPKGAETYWSELETRILELGIAGSVLSRIEYIPDDQIEVFFKSADVLVLPYKEIFQSGVLFLGYSFGLPVIVSDAGSLREDVVEGDTGFVFATRDSAALAQTIHDYFCSDLYRNLETQRHTIQRYASERYSWDTVAKATAAVYERVTECESFSTNPAP